MQQNLMEINNYGLITFASTAYALKAEKVMKGLENLYDHTYSQGNIS